MCYVLRDFRYHLKRTEVLLVEFLILFLMVIDVFLYSLLNNFKMNKILAFELTVIAFFCLCFVYISFVGINQLDEDIELILMIVRLILQFCRLGISLIRVTETNSKRKAAAEDINLEFSVKTAD